MLLRNSTSPTLKDKLLEIGLLGFILTMPFKIQVNSLFLILSVVAWLISGHAWTDVRAVLKMRLYQVYLLLYFLYLVGLLYSANTQAAFAELELKVSLLLLPPIFYGRVQDKARQNRYLYTFVLACFIAAAASLALLLYRIYGEGLYRAEGQPLQIDWVYFSYFLPKQIDFHSPFFSMYAVTSMFIVTYWLINAAESTKRWKVIVLVSLLFFFLTFSVALASRTALVAGITILFIGGIAHFIAQKRYVQVGVFLVLFMAVFGLLYLNTPYLRQKMEGGTGVSQRQQLWHSSFELIKQHPIIGIGSGDARDEQVVQYRKSGLVKEAEQRLDAHNQYIQLALALGLTGVLTYIATLAYLLHLSFRYEVYLLTGFVMLYSMCGVTESVFNAQKGLILFSFITSVLAFKQKHGKNAD
ncbi:O-antigen ligase [uncultured Pontibacter sp.]|uniref:O-antigen ligase family protein n=1 Tax=uncultured Pontibacter sp. TaxID=453356 RepID=UPI002610813D|nr:O-antigen ligase family protein [uncultured Pontibacter sp.]